MDTLEKRRRDALDYLTECYAGNLLDLHQYEDRRDQVLAARTVREIAVVTDLDSPSPTRAAPHGNVTPGKPTIRSTLCIMGDRTVIPDPAEREIQSTCVMGDVTIDLRKGNERVALRVTTVTIMGDTVIRVPQNAVVTNDITAIMADVKDKSRPVESDGPEIHLSGLALMADVKIKRG